MALSPQPPAVTSGDQTSEVLLLLAQHRAPDALAEPDLSIPSVTTASQRMESLRLEKPSEITEFNP